MENKKKKAIQASVIMGFVAALAFAGIGIGVFMDNAEINNLIEDKQDGYVEKWHELAEINSYDFWLGENSPTGGGWLATFCLDYAETPGTCLASNASGGGYDSWGNVSGYVDEDNKEIDLKSNDPFYFTVRARFNATQCKDGGVYKDTRTRVNITVSGDETISNVAGTRVVSFNSSDADYIFINFYWDDEVDGYRITDDGSLVWSIVISAKY